MEIPMRVRHALIAVLLVLFALAATSGTALAHAELVSSTPADGASLAAASATLVLVFSEELKTEGNLITVTDAAGKQVDQGDTTLDLNDPKRVTLTVSLKSGLGDGLYSVSWENASTDGHSEEGTLSFTVGAAPATAPAALPATGAGDALPRSGLLALAAALLLVGVGLRRRPS